MGLRDNFKKGTVEMMVLYLLAESDMYGYQISQMIAARSGEVITVPEGSLYPTLYRLLERGYISDQRIQVGKRMTRVYYHLEPSGRERLDQVLMEYSVFSEGMDRFLSSRAPAPAAPPAEEAP